MQSSTLSEDKEFFFVVDFTWNDGHLTLLEMGDYYLSSISGLDQLREIEGKGPLNDDIKARVKTKYPEAVSLYDVSFNNSLFRMGAIGLHDFEQGIQTEYSIKNLSPITRLIQARAALPDTTKPLRNLVVTFGAELGLSFEEAAHIESSMATSTNFCILNFPSGGLHFSCINKVAFYLFNYGGNTIPSTCLIDLFHFDENRVNEFLAQCADTHFIIKPTDKSQGRGVSLIPREEILTFLNKLHDYRCRKSPSGTMTPGDYWHYATDQFLLLQTCCRSKKNQDGYHPTGRAVIRAQFSAKDEKVQIDYLGGYWKLPAKASDEPSTQSVISDVHGADELHVAKIDLEDWAAITRNMDENFAPILMKMFGASTQEMANQFEHHADPVMRCYGKYTYPTEILTDNKKKEPPSIESILKRLIDAGMELRSNLTYRKPGSMQHLDHFVSATLGLMCDTQCSDYNTLKQALYLQLGMKNQLLSLENSRQHTVSSINNTNTLFIQNKNPKDDREAVVFRAPVVHM